MHQKRNRWPIFDIIEISVIRIATFKGMELHSDFLNTGDPYLGYPAILVVGYPEGRIYCSFLEFFMPLQLFFLLLESFLPNMSESKVSMIRITLFSYSISYNGKQT